MLTNGLICFIVVVCVTTHGFSDLTDNDPHHVSETKQADVFCQLLNPEAIIRMSMVKNANVQMKDMLTVKQTLLSLESDISTLKQTTTELQKELDKLKQENEFISRENAGYKENITTVQGDIGRIFKTQQELKDYIDKSRRTFENNINATDVLANMMNEVRYIKLTVLNMNEKVSVDLEKVPSIINKQAKLLISSFSDEVNKTINKLQSEVKLSQLERHKLSSAVSSLESFQVNLTRNINVQKAHIGFTAGITSSNGGFTGSKIIFTKVLYNEGQSYDSTTGVFTSPVEGHFVFFTTSHSASKNLETDIVLNGISKVRTEAYNSGGASYQTGTNMVLMKLQRGDRVWVKRSAATGYYSESIPIMTFSGFIL